MNEATFTRAEANVAIATRIGWTDIRDDGKGFPPGSRWQGLAERQRVPDFFTDHAAKHTLLLWALEQCNTRGNANLAVELIDWLEEKTHLKGTGYFWQLQLMQLQLMCATPEQIALAMCDALGLKVV